MFKVQRNVPKHLIGILLFKYFNVFEDGKVRPGFVIDDRVFVLTHTYPGELSYIQPIEINADKICKNVSKSYIVEVGYQQRASNTCAGYVVLSPENLKKSFGISPKENHFFIIT